MSIFEVALESFIDMNHELVLLSRQIDGAEELSRKTFSFCLPPHRTSPSSVSPP